MTISVAMTTFNGNSHLREQLDSIKRQSLQPMELIICDDGSSDDTVEIARSFAAEAAFKVSIDAHGQRLGYNGNFIRAVNQCVGDIVVLCDQDDVWRERKLEVVCSEFRDSSVSAVIHRVQVVDERLNPTPLTLPPATIRGKLTLQTLDPWFAPGGMYLAFRRAGVASWLNEPPSLSKWCRGPAPFDEWIFFLATLDGSVVVLDEVLGVWRRHSASETGNPEATATVYSAAFQRQLALTVGSTQYAYQAEVAGSRADFAARSGSAVSGSSRQTLERAANFYHRVAATFRRRSHLHDPASRRLRRFLTLGSMFWSHDYRGPSRGGLSLKSLLKDVYAVLRGPNQTNLVPKSKGVAG